MPRGIGLNCDGMRRCQRLPEFTHPVDSARRREVHQMLCPRDLQELFVKFAAAVGSSPHEGDAVTSGVDGEDGAVSRWGRGAALTVRASKASEPRERSV
jgi:hypothetical protein